MATKTKKKLEFLTKAELKKLLRVDTKTAWAKRIKKRNQLMLNFLNTLPDTWEDYDKYEGEHIYIGYFGCQHCIDCNANCKECKWVNFDKKLNHEFEMCSCATFGGITLKNLISLGSIFDPLMSFRYFTNEEEISINLHICNYDFNKYLEHLEKCKIFVRAHIEWADAVIELNKKARGTKEKT